LIGEISEACVLNFGKRVAATATVARMIVKIVQNMIEKSWDFLELYWISGCIFF
jgi:hypothetical protein